MQILLYLCLGYLSVLKAIIYLNGIFRVLYG